MVFKYGIICVILFNVSFQIPITTRRLRLIQAKPFRTMSSSFRTGPLGVRATPYLHIVTNLNTTMGEPISITNSTLSTQEEKDSILSENEGKHDTSTELHTVHKIEEHNDSSTHGNNYDETPVNQSDVENYMDTALEENSEDNDGS